MAANRPHITISYDGRYGVVAASAFESYVADHMMRRVGFQQLPDSQLYVLGEPKWDPVRRGRQAAESLRAVGYSVTSDAMYKYQTPSSPAQSSTPGRTGAAETPVTSGQALHADIRSGRVVVHDQVRDADGTLRAVGTDLRTGEGLLLYDEGDLRYIETRLDTTDRAFEAFSYIRGSGAPTPRVGARTASRARCR